MDEAFRSRRAARIRPVGPAHTHPGTRLDFDDVVPQILGQAGWIHAGAGKGFEQHARGLFRNHDRARAPEAGGPGEGPARIEARERRPREEKPERQNQCGLGHGHPIAVTDEHAVDAQAGIAAVAADLQLELPGVSGVERDRQPGWSPADGCRCMRPVAAIIGSRRSASAPIR